RLLRPDSRRADATGRPVPVGGDHGRRVPVHGRLLRPAEPGATAVPTVQAGPPDGDPRVPAAGPPAGPSGASPSIEAGAGSPEPTNQPAVELVLPRDLVESAPGTRAGLGCFWLMKDLARAYDAPIGTRCPTAGAYKPESPRKGLSEPTELPELAASPGL